jgi:hypothetical protein
VLAPGASLAATAVVSNANDGIGILVFGPTLPDVQLADCHAGGNVTGIAVIGRSVVVENCTATASGPSMGGPPRASAS